MESHIITEAVRLPRGSYEPVSYQGDLSDADLGLLTNTAIFVTQRTPDSVVARQDILIDGKGNITRSGTLQGEL